MVLLCSISECYLIKKKTFQFLFWIGIFVDMTLLTQALYLVGYYSFFFNMACLVFGWQIPWLSKILDTIFHG